MLYENLKVTYSDQNTLYCIIIVIIVIFVHNNKTLFKITYISV